MATYNKFEIFVEDLLGKVHDLFGSGAGIDDVNVYLSNAAPNAATHAVKADVAEISAGNGYAAGGESVTPVGSRTGGTATLAGTNVTWTADSGAIATFRYVVLYNDTPTSPADPLIAWWDRGSALDLADGDSFTVKFDGGATDGDIFTLA